MMQNNERGESQRTKVLAWLQEAGPITPIEALRYFGAFRLSGIIYVLRNQGHNIHTEMVTEGNKTYARYHYRGTDEK